MGAERAGHAVWRDAAGDGERGGSRDDTEVHLLMATEKKTLRSVRKARHAWFDYEVVDQFGDELGPFGLTVYMVLARMCHGGTRVCLSLRELAMFAGQGKDKARQSVDTLVRLGLIQEHRGATATSKSCFDLLDVKDLLEEMRANGIALKEPPILVFVADSEAGKPSEGTQSRAVHVVLGNRRAGTGDASMRQPIAVQGSVDLRASGAGPVADDDCLPDRQLGVKGADGYEDGAAVLPHRQVVLPHRQSCPATQTILSATAQPFNSFKKEEVRKEQDTPLPPRGGGELLLPFAGVRYGDPNWALSLGLATRWVMAECGVVADLRANKRFQDAIRGALELHARQTRQELREIARLGVTNWRAYEALGDLREFPLGLAKFFAEGYWKNPEALRYDRRRAAAAAAGAGGQTTADPAGDEAGDEAVPAMDEAARLAGETLWEAVKRGLKSTMNLQSWQTWIQPMRGMGLCGGVLYVRMPSLQFSHIQDKYGAAIRALLPEAVTAMKLVRSVQLQEMAP